MVGDKKYDASSLSIELTSTADTLWTYYHTARDKDPKRPGVKRVDGDSQYRIASITKTFTALAILYQHAAGNLSLDDPVSEYIPELAGDDGGEVPWKDITVRIMASQLSGIPREFGFGDLLNRLQDPTGLGLPPASRDSLTACEREPEAVVCSKDELLTRVKQYKPIMAPNQQSTYANLNFELLGVVIEKASGMNYSDYIRESMFGPLNMKSSTLQRPSDAHAVLPKGDDFWDFEQGAVAPTGGIYSSSSDLSKFLRFILTHYNALATGVNWMMPASWGTGMQTFYGMPFEIFRSDTILPESRRPVTFINKSGSLPGYYSIILMMPEYGLGITILVGGEGDLLGEVREMVTVAVTTAAETAVWEHMEEKYTGSFAAADESLNSSLSLTSSPASGLVLSSFISNDTDVLGTVIPKLASPFISDQPWRAQLVPTLLFKNETTQQGEIFRLVVMTERQPGAKVGVWDEFCPSDIDVPGTYAGLPLNEVVFWHEARTVELPAWKLILKPKKGRREGMELFKVQTAV